MTHTPTPWICDSEGILPTRRDGISVIARIPNHPENQKNWDADAAFIVRAVNSHEALVKALAGFLDAANVLDGVRAGGSLERLQWAIGNAERAHQAARDAIALACTTRRAGQDGGGGMSEQHELLPFLALWAIQYQKDYSLNGLHPIHYDLMVKYGARMDDFKRATNAPMPATPA